jgi:hypothetical protein
MLAASRISICGLIAFKPHARGGSYQMGLGPNACQHGAEITRQAVKGADLD